MMSKYKPYEVSEEILDEAEVSGDFEGTLRDYFTAGGEGGN